MRGYDLTNKQYGNWTVLKLDEELSKIKKKKYWICQCKCGTIKSVRQDNLTSQVSKSCGCLTHLQSGQIFGYLKLIYKNDQKRADLGSKNAVWHCKCLRCGKEVDVRSSDLKSGHTKSCGCLNIEKIKERSTKDLTGQNFGYLTVLSQVESDINGHAKWKCKCQCGTVIDVLGTNLIRGHTISCGCYKNSKGEERILNFLIDNNINYKRQYSFSDLSRINPLRFDFAIFKNNTLFCLIEYQGEQHYQCIEHWGGEKGLIQRQENDNLKKNYCINNNIKLIEIPYTEYKQINDILSKELL